jgi:hypothetical protein
MAPGGVLVIELHRPELLVTEFSSLGIRIRSVTLGDGTTIECAWPAGPIDWVADDLIAAMPVQVIVRQTRDIVEYINFVSTEHMYQPVHIEQACQLAGGGFSLEDWTSEVEGVFPSSTVLGLRRH